MITEDTSITMTANSWHFASFVLLSGIASLSCGIPQGFPSFYHHLTSTSTYTPAPNSIISSPVYSMLYTNCILPLAFVPFQGVHCSVSQVLSGLVTPSKEAMSTWEHSSRFSDLLLENGWWSCCLSRTSSWEAQANFMHPDFTEKQMRWRHSVPQRPPKTSWPK